MIATFDIVSIKLVVMRIVFSELSPNYSSYTFPHAVYAIPENTEEVPQIYNQGFLPYSADTSKTTTAFYLARSLRIMLSDFADSSENRRVDRKMEIEKVHISAIRKADFNIDDPVFLSFCEKYISERMTPGAMPMERLKYILQHELTTHLLEFRNEAGDLLGIIVSSLHSKMLHYWFAFFDNSFRENAPIGKWIMWKSIRWAQEQGLDYIYLGTCYGSKSLYKARDFKGVQFFDGEVWNSNLKELKKRVKEDEEQFDVDRWRREDLLMD